MFVTLPRKVEEFERLVGFNYIKNQLEPKTPFGSKYFKHLKPLSFEHITQHLEDTQFFVNLFKKSELDERILNDFECIIDVTGSLERLKAGEIIDEIELFEIKNYALVVESIRERFVNKVPEHLLPPSLQSVINILDPDGHRLPTFYIYDTYNEELHKLRKRKRELQKMINIDNNEILNSELVEIENKLIELEKEILKMLSSKLSKHIFLLLESVEKIKYLDVIISKARLAIKLGLSRPKILRKIENNEQIKNSNNDNFTIKIAGMFNPQLKEELESKKKMYQPVDITVTPKVTVIVGANMSGKSVVLRTVALIQYMAQLGFFVPAKDCETEYLEHIALICEDFQKPLSGLSSFGAEILLINEALDISRKSKGLVLIDEPARTTNPYEGTAIVNAIVESFKALDCYTLIVTHFDYVNAPRRLRVKGLRDEVETLPEKVHGKANDLLGMLQDYIDYQLIESADSLVPKEATKIMELLGVDNEIVNFVKRQINNYL